MKKIILTLTLAVAAIGQMMALTHDEIRQEARFLSDRMAHELNLTPQQYEDCYEINYDFIASINPYMDQVVRGYDDAYDRYYDHLNYRNEDLRYILNEIQYTAFLGCEYFLRPVYVNASRWLFRIHDIYHGWHFFLDPPHIYHTYYGGHGRHHHPHGYYINRYHHHIYAHPHHIERHYPSTHHRGGYYGDHHRGGNAHVNRGHAETSHGNSHGSRPAIGSGNHDRGHNSGNGSHGGGNSMDRGHNNGSHGGSAPSRGSRNSGTRGGSGSHGGGHNGGGHNGGGHNGNSRR